MLKKMRTLAWVRILVRGLSKMDREEINSRIHLK